MKICGIICEYNPFHNGHAYLLERAKKESGCELTVCAMSGNFTQRGEPAFLGKYARARHAVLAGADAVIEIPAPFACAPAEIFAKGAVKLLASLPDFSSLAFGCESGNEESFLAAAKALSDESRTMKAAIREKLKKGISLIKARTEAAAETEPLSAPLLSSPNNVLGVEYQKALLFFGSGARVLPVLRTGGGHADAELAKNYSSATAIREGVRLGKLRAVKRNVPEFVFDDLKNAPDTSAYKALAVYAALSRPAEQLKKILDCTEGLENRIKALAKGNPDYDALVGKVTTKRYISSRVRRILAAAVLGIEEELVRKSLKNKLYLNVLAVKKERADDVLPALARSEFPLLTRASDEKKLTRTAMECYEKDLLADDIYSFITRTPARGGRTVFV